MSALIPPRIRRASSPRRRITRSPVARLVLLFLLLSVAPVALLAVASVRLASNAVTGEVEGRVRSAAALSSVAIGAELTGVSELVQSYARRPSLIQDLASRRTDPTPLTAHLLDLEDARLGIAATFLARMDGRLLEIVPATASIVGKDFSFRDWYRGVTASGGMYVSEAYESQAAGHPLVVAVATIVREPAPRGRGRPLGILVAAYKLGALRRFVDGFAASQDVALRVTDQRGTVLAQPGAPGRGLHSQRADPLVAAALRGRAGLASPTWAGREVLAAYEPVQGLGWTVTASVPRERALAPVGKVRTAVFAAAGLLGLGLLAGLIGLIRMLQQRRRAEEEADRAREEAEHAAAERARLAAIVQSSDDAITSKTAEGVIASWNPGAERLYGYTAAEAVGRAASMLVPPEHAEEERQVLERVLGGERIPHRETTRLRKDGTVVDVAMSISPISAEDTIVGASAIARDVTEQRRAGEALRRARADAERANRAKSEFLSRMSHELRTPMNAVLGFGQLLELGELGGDERESVRQILSAGNHLLGLINEVLDVARIDAGKLSLSVEPVDVHEALSQAVELIAPIAAARGIAVTVARVEDVCVLADQQRLKQVLLNLLSNAVKYNREGGRIEVELERLPSDRVRIGICDTGYGLAPEQREKLFQPFERLGADAGPIEGTGLGLTLSKGMVEAMGGTVEVESVPGEGSTFWVDLRETESAEARREQLDEQVALVGPGGEERGGAVLYIEDNLSNLRLVERVLERFPHVELLAAMQGTLGHELAHRHGPDLILLDLHLPDIDGEQVLARLRAEPETADIPVIVLSADATPKRVERLRAAGAEEYLSKPFDVVRLMELLREHLPEGERAAAEGPTRGGS